MDKIKVINKKSIIYYKPNVVKRKRNCSWLSAVAIVIIW